MYLLIESPRPASWTWVLFTFDHRRVAACAEAYGRREECLSAAARHLGGEIEVPVVERDAARAGRVTVAPAYPGQSRIA